VSEVARSRPSGATPAGGTPPADTNYILGQAEFHQNIGALHGAICRETIGLRQFIGWVLATIGLASLLLGLAIMSSRDGMDVHG